MQKGQEIVEYRVWTHPKDGGDDCFERFATLEAAKEALPRMEKSAPEGSYIEKPLVVFKEYNRFWEARPDDLSKRTFDVILNTEIVGRLVGNLKEILEASIDDPKKLKALKSVVTDRIYKWWFEEGK